MSIEFLAGKWYKTTACWPGSHDDGQPCGRCWEMSVQGPPPDIERCIYCGARAVRGPGGRITWAFMLEQLAAAGDHEHETIQGEA